MTSQRIERRRRTLKWSGSLTTWWTGKGGAGDYTIVLRDDRRYHVSGPKLRSLSYPTLIDATEACERAAECTR